jgi:hypothetical protein
MDTLDSVACSSFVLTQKDLTPLRFSPLSSQSEAAPSTGAASLWAVNVRIWAEGAQCFHFSLGTPVLLGIRERAARFFRASKSLISDKMQQLIL